MSYCQGCADSERLSFTLERSLAERDETIAALQERNAELEAQLAAATRNNICDVCVGSGKAAGDRPCICGGSGLICDAFLRLRKDYVELFESRDRALSELVETQKRLEYYFTFKSPDRPQEFLDLEMRIIAGEGVALADWIAAIDKGIAARAAIPDPNNLASISATTNVMLDKSPQVTDIYGTVGPIPSEVEPTTSSIYTVVQCDMCGHEAQSIRDPKCRISLQMFGFQRSRERR